MIPDQPQPYARLFAPPRPEDFIELPDPFGRLDAGPARLAERRPPDDDPGWDAARADWMGGAPLTGIVGGDPFALFGSVGRDRANRRADVFRLQALLHREGHLDAEATAGPTGYWGNRDDAALRAFQKEHGLAVDGYADPGGETIGRLERFYRPQHDPGVQTMERRSDQPPVIPQTMEKRGRDTPLVPIPLDASEDRTPRTQQYAQAQGVLEDASPDPHSEPAQQRHHAPQPLPQPRPPASGWRVDETGLKKIRDAEKQGRYIHTEFTGAPETDRRSRECVALVQGVMPDIGQTKTWREGDKIKGPNDPPIDPGTAIATFKDGRYPNKGTGNHAAIFLRYGDKDGNDGIWVLDQYEGKTAGERHIRFTNAGGSNSAGAFSVIRRDNQ